MAEAMGLYQFGPQGLAQTDHRREPRLVHLRPRRDQPARPGQRLLHAGRQRHAVRRPPGDGGPRPVRRAGCGRRRRTAGRGRQLHARGHPARASRTRSTRCCARTSSPATPARPAPARLRAAATRSPARPGTTQNNLSVAFVGYTPEITASVMVFNPKERRGRRRLRRRQGRDHLARRDGADPDRPGERRLPAGRPGRRPRQHQPVPGLHRGEPTAAAVLAAAGFDSTHRADRQRQAGGRARRHQPAARRPGRARPAGHDPGQQRVGLRARARADADPAHADAEPADPAPEPTPGRPAAAAGARRCPADPDRPRRAGPPACPAASGPGGG